MPTRLYVHFYCRTVLADFAVLYVSDDSNAISLCDKKLKQIEGNCQKLYHKAKH